MATKKQQTEAEAAEALGEATPAGASPEGTKAYTLATRRALRIDGRVVHRGPGTVHLTEREAKVNGLAKKG